MSVAEQFKETHVLHANRYAKTKPRVDDDGVGDVNERAVPVQAGSIVVLSSLVWHRRWFL